MRSALLIILCGITCVVCGTREEVDVTSSMDLTPLAKEFVILLSQEDYGGCVARFDQTMKNGLPEPKLQEAWNTVLSQAGGFQNQIGVRQTRESGYDIVYVTCQFEHSRIDIKVVFNADQEVTGLWFRPAK